jgi:DNA invertase Pin-like site-specific DNA recombinase
MGVRAQPRQPLFFGRTGALGRVTRPKDIQSQYRNGSLLRILGPISGFWSPIGGRRGILLARPLPAAGGGGMHRTPFGETKRRRRRQAESPLERGTDAPLIIDKSIHKSKVLYDLSGVVLPSVLLCTKYFQKLDREMTAYGYARVSTNGQALAAQEAELLAAGASKVFKEKVSGAKADRAELAKVIRRLEPGDLLLVTRLDRLARSTRDLLNVLATIGERQAGFRSLKDTWADTTTPHGRLMLTVLGGLAEFERELILARTSDGRARAKARGVRFGRPSALTPHQRQEAIQRLEEGATQADLARTYGVSQATISRLAAA